MGHIETGGLASTKFIEGQPTDLHITRHMDLIKGFVFALKLIDPSLDSFPFQFAQQVPLMTILVHFAECDNRSKFLASFGRDLSFALRACNHWRGCFAHWLPNLFSRDPESRFYSNRNRNRCPMQFKQQKSKPGPNSLDFVRLKIGGVQIPLPTSN